MGNALRRANVKWFSDSQKRKGRARRTSPRQIVVLRLREFAILFRARYGSHELPDDDSGRDDLEPVLHHIAALAQPVRRAEHWLALWAPWLPVKELRAMVASALMNARPWTADQLAWRYRVTKEERTMLGLTTIGAIDHGKAARTKARKAKERERKARARALAGAKPRAEYEANATERAKPWIALGISRATWYRRRETA